MPGTKRKASFAFPYERPAKLMKSSTSTTVVSKKGTLAKSPSVKEPRFTPLKFPSLRATKPATREIALSSSGSSGSDITTPPSLRRASTLTLEDSDDKTTGTSPSGSGKRSLSNASSKTPSLSKKTSDVAEGSLVTRLSGLQSGSIVGETTAADPEPSTSGSDSVSKLSPRKLSTKKLSSKKSSVGKGVPSFPSGLTKLALTKLGTSINVTKTGLIDNVDETEMNEALASLKSHLSKEMSISGKDYKEHQDEPKEDISAAENDDEEAMDADEPSTVAVDLPMPPGGYLDIAISFDTTSSMMAYMNEVKAKVQSLVQRLQADIPGIHIAIIAHGDYCDVDKYIVKWIDFGASVPEICDFVTNVESTYGGDGPECYELVLQRARGVLSWRRRSQKVLIMIGDDVPHEPGYTYAGKTYHINWREECQKLKEMGVKVYGVQAGSDSGSTKFNIEMARITSGCHLKLDKFDSCFDFLMMICYCEGNPAMLQTYEEEMRARDGRLNKDVSLCMAELGGGGPKVTKATSVKKTALTSSKVTTKPVKASKKVKPILPKKTKAVSTKKATKQPIGKRKALVKKKKVELKSNRVLKREKLTDANLTKGPLSKLKWTKWIHAILPEQKGKTKKTVVTKPCCKKKGKVAADKSTNPSQYTSCKHMPGLRLKRVFDNDTTTPAIYEIAVQCGESRASKKYVMYYRRSVGWANRGRRWDMYLLRHETVKAEVKRALDSGFSICVRRGVPMGKTKAQMKKKLGAAHDYIRDHYDYAWKKYVWRKTDGTQTHRQVKVSSKGVKEAVISHSNI